MVEEVGTYGEVKQVYGSDDWWNEACNGTNGTSYGSGALGGTGGKVEKTDYGDNYGCHFSASPTAGANGWVYIEYGGDI